MYYVFQMTHTMLLPIGGALLANVRTSMAISDMHLTYVPAAMHTVRYFNENTVQIKINGHFIIVLLQSWYIGPYTGIVTRRL